MAPDDAAEARQTMPLLLCLSGGGFRGYYSALVLAAVEEAVGAPCNRIFDLIAGTSIGGILALGLAHGVPARTLADMIGEHGPAIFPRYPLPGLRRAFGPPYRGGRVGDAVKRILPAQASLSLSAAPTPVMVVSVSPATARLVVLSSWDGGATALMSTADAAMATSADPTYFPSHRASLGSGGTSMDLVDGGIAANAPDALAIREATFSLGLPEERLAILSVGTCAPAQGGVGTLTPAAFGVPGTLGRLGGRGIVDLMMAVQEAHGIAEAKARLGGGRYLRLDRAPSDAQAKLLQLDNASGEARQTLEDLAQQTQAGLRDHQSHGVWRRMVARAQFVRR